MTDHLDKHEMHFWNSIQDANLATFLDVTDQ